MSSVKRDLIKELNRPVTIGVPEVQKTGRGREVERKRESARESERVTESERERERGNARARESMTSS